MMADLRRFRGLLIATALAWPAATRGAIIQWTGTATGGDGVSFHDPLNWTNTDAEPDVVGVVPGGNDSVRLDGATVHITTNVVIRRWHTEGGNGQVHIDAGGTLSGTNSYTVRYATIHVNDGGVFNADPTWGASRASITVNEGGELTGVVGMGTSNDSNTLTVNGTVNLGGTSAAALNFSLGATTGTIRWGKLLLGETGQLNFDVFGNNTSERIVVGNHQDTVLQLDSGTIHLRPQDYTPQVGDTFDLWNVVDDSEADLSRVGNGTNIHLEGYILDTSTFASDGVVTVTGALPEPASLAWLGLGGVLLFRRRGRRG